MNALEHIGYLYKQTHIVEMNARRYAVKCHESTNHRYGEHYPYYVHLCHVRHIAEQFKYLVPSEHHAVIFAGCWTHDVIEDCRQTYNDVKQATNEQIANLTYALTTPKGKNRKERNNPEYYQGIKDCEGALFIKLCDRIANMEFSKDSGSSMFEMYKKELSDFKDNLHEERYHDMFVYMVKMVL